MRIKSLETFLNKVTDKPKMKTKIDCSRQLMTMTVRQKLSLLELLMEPKMPKIPKKLLDSDCVSWPHVSLIRSVPDGVWRLRGKVKQVIKVYSPKIHLPLPQCQPKVTVKTHAWGWFFLPLLLDKGKPCVFCFLVLRWCKMSTLCLFSLLFQMFVKSLDVFTTLTASLLTRPWPLQPGLDQSEASIQVTWPVSTNQRRQPQPACA